jgi:hypothetical protein
MKTPITDAVYPPDIIDREFKAQGRTYGWGTLHDMRDVARRLELDRAALMEALESVSKDFTTFRQIAAENGVFGTWGVLSLRQSETALAAARANFPNA